MSCITLSADIVELESAMNFLKDNIPKGYESSYPHARLALEEIFINIAKYAYINEPMPADMSSIVNNMHNKIKLKIDVTHINKEALLRLTISDWGTAYNPFLEAQNPDISLSVEDRPIGGLGIFLVKQVVKYYTYQFKNFTNIVELFFAQDSNS